MKRLTGIMEEEGLEFRHYEQCPVHEVYVLCGWPRQVVTLRDCVRSAMDISRHDNNMRCIAAWQFVHSAITQHIADDYVGVGKALVQAIVSLMPGH